MNIRDKTKEICVTDSGMSEQVICLSDSDDENAESAKYNTDSIEKFNDDHEMQTDFDFPPINFHYIANNSTNVINVAKQTNNIKKTVDAFAASSINPLNLQSRDNNVNFEVRSRDDFSKHSEITAEPRNVQETRKKKRKKSHRSDNLSNNDAEKIRTKQQLAIEKRLASLEKQYRKNIQPGECLKFIIVVIDEELKNCPFYTDILQVLGNYEISHRSESHSASQCITWTRKVERHYVDDDNEICTKTEIQREKFILIIRTWDEIVQTIEDETFVSTIAAVVSLFPDHRSTLVVYGVEEYFERRKKSTKHRSKDSPKISRYDVEFALAEIQLTLGCNSALVETAQELAMTVYRFTKSIAEIPFKAERRRIAADKVDWYAAGDNRDTVKVDKNGNGLRRLWQQQICQFPLANLEIAEAVCSVYPSPRELMEAYANCTPADGEKLLKDIPIRRAAGPLTTARKIGRELSKKIFIMFTAKNGEETLGNDRIS